MEHKCWHVFPIPPRWPSATCLLHELSETLCPTIFSARSGRQCVARFHAKLLACCCDKFCMDSRKWVHRDIEGLLAGVEQ